MINKDRAQKASKSTGKAAKGAEKAFNILDALNVVNQAFSFVKDTYFAYQESRRADERLAMEKKEQDQAYDLELKKIEADTAKAIMNFEAKLQENQNNLIQELARLENEKNKTAADLAKHLSDNELRRHNFDETLKLLQNIVENCNNIQAIFVRKFEDTGVTEAALLTPINSIILKLPEIINSLMQVQQFDTKD